MPVDVHPAVRVGSIKFASDRIIQNLKLLSCEDTSAWRVGAERSLRCSESAICRTEPARKRFWSVVLASEAQGISNALEALQRGEADAEWAIASASTQRIQPLRFNTLEADVVLLAGWSRAAHDDHRRNRQRGFDVPA
jgi:hypothetical protein